MVSETAALVLQASKGRPSMVRLLLKAGAAVDAQDRLGEAPGCRCDSLSMASGSKQKCAIRLQSFTLNVCDKR